MTPPSRKPSRLRWAARALVLGIGLGIVAGVATTLVTYEIATRLVVWRWAPTTGAWVFQRLLLGQLGPLVLAPLATHLAGRAVPGLPWPVAAVTVATLQLTAVLQRGVFEGFEALANPEDLTLIAVFTLGGAALASWTLAVAGRRKADPKPAAPPAPQG